MSGPNCHNCIYSVCDPELWLRWMDLGEPIVPRCANHPRWPGQLRDVPGTICRNYRRKPDPPTGDVRLIPLAEGSYVYVDAADYEWLSRWNWHMAGGGYAARVENGTTVLMHRVIMQAPKGMVVDHADGNKANNCRTNLRVCTRKENQRNIRKQRGARSPFKGVYYDIRRGKIFAQYYFEGKVRWLGYFATGLDAARAHDGAVVETFGEFARVNFPREWPPQRRAEVYALRREAMKKERKKVKRTGGKKPTRGAKRAVGTTERTKVRRMEGQKAGGKRAQPDARSRDTKPPNARPRRKTMRK